MWFECEPAAHCVTGERGCKGAQRGGTGDSDTRSSRVRIAHRPRGTHSLHCACGLITSSPHRQDVRLPAPLGASSLALLAPSLRLRLGGERIHLSDDELCLAQPPSRKHVAGQRQPRREQRTPERRTRARFSTAGDDRSATRTTTLWQMQMAGRPRGSLAARGRAWRWATDRACDGVLVECCVPLISSRRGLPCCSAVLSQRPRRSPVFARSLRLHSPPRACGPVRLHPSQRAPQTRMQRTDRHRETMQPQRVPPPQLLPPTQRLRLTQPSPCAHQAPRPPPPLPLPPQLALVITTFVACPSNFPTLPIRAKRCTWRR